MATRRLVHRSLFAAAVALALPALLSAQATKKPAAPAKPGAQTGPAVGPVVVVDTAKGSFEIGLYPEDAPKSVAHFLALVKKNFYNGLRVHRVEPGFVVQWGDRKTRDMTKRESWGRGPDDGSGKPVGVAEFSKRTPMTRGALGMAHSGDAKEADSQIFVLLGDRPNLAGKYAIFGRVISGMDVVSKLEVTDVIKRMTLKTS